MAKFVTTASFLLADIRSDAFDAGQSADTIRGAIADAGLCDMPVVAIDVSTALPVLQAQWDDVQHDDANIVLLQLPEGGGGKSNPLQIILQLALLTLGFFTGGATWGIAFMRAGLTVGLSLLANAVMPRPEVPQQQNATALAAAPTYDLRGASNQLGLGYTIPVQSGRCLAAPTLIAHPYYEYIDGDQYLHLLLCLGEGQFTVHNIYFSDLEWSRIAGATKQVVYNGAPTLFPSRVYSADEIDGVTLSSDYTIPAYANPPGTTVTRIGIDTGLMRGVGQYDDQGNLNALTVTVETRYRLVNDEGSPIGAWGSFYNNYSGKTVTPVRRTEYIDVAAGRYEVQRRRVEQVITSTPINAPEGSLTAAQGTTRTGYEEWLIQWRSSTAPNAVNVYTSGAYIVFNGAGIAGKTVKVTLTIDGYNTGELLYLAYSCGSTESNRCTTGWSRFAVPHGLDPRRRGAKYKLLYTIPASAPSSHRVSVLPHPDEGGGLYICIKNVRVDVLGYIAKSDSTDTRVLDDTVWGGLRGYQRGNVTYPGQTIVALRVRATEQLSGAAQNQVKIDCTAKKPVWNGSAWVTQDTRSAVWFIADALKNQTYGGKWADSRIPKSEFLALDNQLKSLSYNPLFDYRFEQRTTLQEAVSTAARVIRAKSWIQGGYLRLWRDSGSTVINQWFSADDVDNLQIHYEMPRDVPADGVEVSYIDNNTGQEKYQRYIPAGSYANNVETVRFAGCAEKAHAAAEAKYLYESDKKRGTLSFTAALQGRIPTIGSRVAVDRDGGHIVAVDGNEVFLSNPVDFYDGNGVLQETGGIQFRARTGAPILTLYTCTPGTADAQPGRYKSVIVAGVLPSITLPDSVYEATRYCFWVGDSTDRYYQSVVTNISYSEGKASITGAIVVDIADDGLPDSDDGRLLGAQTSAPVLTGLTARQYASGKNINIVLTWAAAKNATRYEVMARLEDGVNDGRAGADIDDYPSDNDNTPINDDYDDLIATSGRWDRIYSGTAKTVSYIVRPKEAVNFIVRAVGSQSGKWIPIIVVAGKK